MVYANLSLFGVLSSLGLFSSLLLGHYTELANFVPERVSWGVLTVSFVCIFNVLGFALKHTENRIFSHYRQAPFRKGRIVLYFFCVGLSLALLNYMLFVFFRWVGDAAHPFIVRQAGLRMMILVWFAEMISLSLLLANRALSHIHSLSCEKQALLAKNREVRYRALQSQLNPHFLFNSLNTLVSEIAYDPDTAVRFTQELSDVYRYVLQKQDFPTVSLGEELEFAGSFLYLHQVRLGAGLAYAVDVPPGMRHFRIPPLSLQVLIENVIKHNSVSEEEPVRIRITADPEKGILTVSNRKRAKAVFSDGCTGKGLDILDRRYRLLGAGGIRIRQGEDFFEVTLPLLEE